MYTFNPASNATTLNVRSPNYRGAGNTRLPEVWRLYKQLPYEKRLRTPIH